MKRAKNIVFVTGTDTGVGKTVFTGMLLHYLRKNGCHALAMKPFCSGSLSDVEILRELQGGELSLREINPYYFPDPVAPIASRKRKKVKITAASVAENIRTMARRCDLLLVEGCGGLMVPITRNLFLIDVIAELKCSVVLVGANKLGVLNHVVLSVAALKARRLSKLTVALMNQAHADASTISNRRILADLLAPVSVHTIDFLGNRLHSADVIKKRADAIGTFWKEAVGNLLPDGNGYGECTKKA